MADINIGSDQLLTTTLNDNDRLTFTRAETGQQIATMTVADFRRIMCGVDYSILSERLLPDEFWPDDDGTPKPVYMRSIIGTTQTERGQYIHLVDGIRRAEIIHASLYATAERPDVKPKTIVNNNGTLSYNLFYDIYIRNYEVAIYKSLVLDAQGLETLGKLFLVTVKYTKI